jgi:hypothetical protein
MTRHRGYTIRCQIQYAVSRDRNITNTALATEDHKDHKTSRNIAVPDNKKFCNYEINHNTANILHLLLQQKSPHGTPHSMGITQKINNPQLSPASATF